MATSSRGSQYHHVRANRLAFHPASKRDNPPFFAFVLDGQLAGMSLPTSVSQLIALKQTYNVGLVCSLIEESSCPPLDMFSSPESGADSLPDSLHIDWRDLSAPTTQQMDELLSLTHSYIERGMAVVYHCFAGKGRTGTGLACYLLRYHGDSFDAATAMQHVRDLRPGSIETLSQEHFIRNYERALKGEPLVAEMSASEEEAPKLFHVRLRPVN